MRKLILAFAVVIPSSLAYAGAFYSGNEMVADYRAHQRILSDGPRDEEDFHKANEFLGFIQGVHDTLNDVVFCTPIRATSGQVAAVVIKYAENSPERWDGPAAALTIDALMEAFPCK